MKNIQKYRAIFLLTFMFGLKIILPVFSGFHFNASTVAEQQEEKSTQEKADEKSAGYEVEATIILNVPHNGFCPLRQSLTANVQELFLPVQYFAIPTPPPWFKS